MNDVRVFSKTPPLSDDGLESGDLVWVKRSLGRFNWDFISGASLWLTLRLLGFRISESTGKTALMGTGQYSFHTDITELSHLQLIIPLLLIIPSTCCPISLLTIFFIHPSLLIIPSTCCPISLPTIFFIHPSLLIIPSTYPTDNLLHPSFLFPEAVGLDFTGTNVLTPADLLHPSVPFSNAANILGLKSTSIDSAFFVRGQQTLSKMVRNWQAVELVCERFGVSHEYLQHQFTGGLTVTLDKKCTWFQWAEQASKQVWHTPLAPCQTDTTFALFCIWKAICFLWKAGGPIATGWEPSKVSTNNNEKDAAVLTQAIIESSKTKLSALLRDQQ
ncbi:hypothetical protein B0H16DRAFT_1476062 [Mycena metata]|uniref:Uncharacterized protein n=1 Tax=Mycena metata TaxID=1033252 RepID=A0AAD7HCB6_9AGAR|nr:hypothetical protein B0H16DRAFT_1476062 [Mycena metata]